MAPLTKLEATVCSARNLPNVDGMWGSCDAFLVLEYQNQMHTSTVRVRASAGGREHWQRRRGARRVAPADVQEKLIRAG